MSRRPGMRELDQRDVEALLTRRAGSDHEDLRRAVTLLASMASGSAPHPTAALADLLDRGFPPAAAASCVRPSTRTPRRWGARIGAVLAAGVASVLVAGVAHALPPALQDGIVELVSALMPFELPRSASAGSGPASGSTDYRPAPATDAVPVGASEGGASPAPTTAAAPAVEDGRPEPRGTGDDGTTAGPSADSTQRAGDGAGHDADETADDTTREPADGGTHDGADDAAADTTEDVDVSDDAQDPTEHADDAGDDD